jgi:aldose 1-epimerase
MVSLVVSSQELLVTEGSDPITWGCYAMVPFAGRIRSGRFTFEGRPYQLPCNKPPHAIHGTAFTRPWQVDGPDLLSVGLGPDWPFGGRVEQRFTLQPDQLTLELRLVADERMPAVLGWHPWFRRRLSGTAAQPVAPSDPIELVVEARSMYVRDDGGLPTGELAPPAPRPWDDCFTDLTGTPHVTWPGVLGLSVESSADHVVAYDGSPTGVCIEPQTGPPDFVNLPGHRSAHIVEAGQAIRATMTWRWSFEPPDPPKPQPGAIDRRSPPRVSSIIDDAPSDAGAWTPTTTVDPQPLMRK